MYCKAFPKPSSLLRLQGRTVALIGCDVKWGFLSDWRSELTFQEKIKIKKTINNNHKNKPNSCRVTFWGSMLPVWQRSKRWKVWFEENFKGFILIQREESREKGISTFLNFQIELKSKHYLNPCQVHSFKTLRVHTYKIQTKHESWPAIPAERLSQTTDWKIDSITVHSFL